MVIASFFNDRISAALALPSPLPSRERPLQTAHSGAPDGGLPRAAVTDIQSSAEDAAAPLAREGAGRQGDQPAGDESPALLSSQRERPPPASHWCPLSPQHQEGDAAPAVLGAAGSLALPASFSLASPRDRRFN